MAPRNKPLKHELELAVDTLFRRYANVQAKSTTLPREEMDKLVADEFEAVVEEVANALDLNEYLLGLERKAVDSIHAEPVVQTARMKKKEQG